MMNTKYYLKNYLPYDLFSLGGCGLYGLMVGFLILENQRLGVIVAILPLLVWFAIVDDRNCLYILLAFTPFQLSPFISQKYLHNFMMKSER